MGENSDPNSAFRTWQRGRGWICAAAAACCALLGWFALSAYGSLHGAAARQFIESQGGSFLLLVKPAMHTLDLARRVAGVLALAWAVASYRRKEFIGARLLAAACGLLGLILMFALV